MLFLSGCYVIFDPEFLRNVYDTRQENNRKVCYNQQTWIYSTKKNVKETQYLFFHPLDRPHCNTSREWIHLATSCNNF